MWKPAAENLGKAQMVYEKLIATLSEDEQLIYKQKVRQITMYSTNPFINYLLNKYALD
jgi:hypothetical protein